MIKQNLLSTKKIKSGLNVMGLFGSIVILLLFKKAGKNLFNLTTPTLDDDNSYVSITNENENVESIESIESIEKFKSGGTKYVKDRQTLANINLAIPLFLLIPCLMKNINEGKSKKQYIIYGLLFAYFIYLSTFFILNNLNNEEFYSNVNDNQIAIFIFICLFSLIYFYYDFKNANNEQFIIKLITSGILIFISVISSSRLWQEDANYKKAQPVPIQVEISNYYIVGIILFTFLIVLFKIFFTPYLFKMIIGFFFTFWFIGLIINFNTQINNENKDKNLLISNRSTEFYNLFFSVMFTIIFLIPKYFGYDKDVNNNTKAVLIIATCSMVTSLISYIVSLNHKSKDLTTTFISKLIIGIFFILSAVKFIFFKHNFDMKDSTGNVEILSFLNIIRKEPIIILSFLGIILFSFIFGTSFTYRYNQQELKDYDIFNDKQKNEKEYENLDDDNTKEYEKYNNTVYNIKKNNIEEKNGFSSSQLNNIRNLVYSGKAYYAIDKNDYDSNYKKIVEKNIESSKDIDWKYSTTIIILFIASIITYVFKKINPDYENMITLLFILINLAIAITYNIFFKNEADNYKNLKEKNTQFSILLELLSIFILFSFFFGSQYFVSARKSLIGENSNKSLDFASSLIFICISIISLFCLIYNYYKLISNKSIHPYFKDDADKTVKDINKGLIDNYITNFVIRISIILIIMIVIGYLFRKQLLCRNDIIESMSV